MWPFKRKPEPTPEERFRDKPESPCGEKITHYEWSSFPLGCPACSWNRERAKREAKLDELAKRVAFYLRELQPPEGAK